MRNAYEDVRRTLEAHGATFGDVVKEELYTKDIDAAVDAADIRREFYGSSSPPASVWVEVSRLVHPDLLIEVSVVAELP